MKKFFLVAPILVIIAGFALAGSTSKPAQAGPAVNIFEQHRQEWLNRDGQLPTGGYGNTNPHPGKSYVFAWIENCLRDGGNCYLEKAPGDPNVGTLPEEIEELFQGIGEDIYTRSGSIHELTLARIYYQYQDVIESWIDQGRYSDTDIIAEIEKLFKQNASKDSYMYFRRWNQSTQPIYTPIAFLWTQLRDRNAEVEFGGNNNDDVSFTSSYSGTQYQAGDGSGPVTGGNYNTYELSRDWLFEAYDIWADSGAYEMDGNYAEHIISAGVLLSDFAKRPDVLAQGGDLAVDAHEMATRSKMIMELMHLDMGMDFSSRQLGGSMGRNKGGHIAEGSIRWPYGVYFDLPDTLATSDNYYRDGHHYASDYRLPELIQDAVELHDEPANYWHIHMEDNGTGGDGNWTFVTPYFNLGGYYDEGSVVGDDWVLNILSDDGSGAKEGQPFKLWIDADPDFFETAQDANRKKTVNRGKNYMYQYHNAAFFRIASGDSLHVIKGNFKFDEGENNLIDNGRGHENDYTVGSGWNFFREGKTAIAMRYLGGTTPAVWAMEVVVIDNLVTGEHVYPTFQAFKDAVAANAELTGSYFITSRGHKIEAGGVAGLVDGKEIWDIPFSRMETVDHRGNQIISWQEASNIGKMTVSKHGLTCTYDFSNPKTWKAYGNGCESGSVPEPSIFIDVPVGHWAYDYIETLYQDGYIAGCSTDPLMYCPDATMTRAESAVFVERGIHGAGYLPAQPSSQAFDDVPLWEWFAKWADGLWDDGYTSGCGTDPLVYCPLQEHTRAEGTVFFLRMLHGASYVPPDPTGIFSDVSSDFWGAKWIEAAYEAGLIPACETSPTLRFCPDDPLDRATAAYMMVRAKGLRSIDVTTYDFDDGTTQGLPSRSCAKEPTSCTTLVTSPVRSGGYALRFTLEGTKFSRSEITLNDEIEMDVDYWIGFSTYLLTWDNSSKNSVVYQTHRATNQPGTSPIIGLRATGSEWRLTYELDDPKMNILWSAPVDKGSWVDWVLHVTYSVSDSGLVELYKDGELIFQEVRRTLALGTTVGPYDRFGIYHGVDETGLRELVYDEIRTTNDPAATYADVAPGL